MRGWRENMEKHHAAVLCIFLCGFAGCTSMESTQPIATALPSSTLGPSATHQATATSLPSPIPDLPIPLAEPVSKTTIETQGVIYDLDWSPDGTILASTGYGEVNLWDAFHGSLLDKIVVGEGVVWDVEWNRDGERLAIAGDTIACSIWDRASGILTPIPVMLTVKSASWSPQDAQLALGLIVERFEVLDMDHQSLVFSGRTIHGVWGIDWSPDGRSIATAEYDGYIKVWDTLTGGLLKIYHSGWMGTNAFNVAWSPDGGWLASSHRDGRVRIWALDSVEGTPYQALERQRGWARGLSWSPDGRRIVSTHGMGPRDDYFVESDPGVSGGAAYLWDVESTALLAVFESDHPTPIWSAAWSPDGKHIALGTGAFNDRIGESNIVILELPQDF
jgi:WD40 repeat protein